MVAEIQGKSQMASKKYFKLAIILILITIAIGSFLIFVRKRDADRVITTLNEVVNQGEALNYCANNPGVSILNGDKVYCDSKGNMWSATLNIAMGDNRFDVSIGNIVNSDSFRWSVLNNDSEDIIKSYGVNDCNEVPKEEIHKFPACNACATLNYAGFSDGWRLPSQKDGTLPINVNCNDRCGRDNIFCAPGRQLWDFGKENCGWDSDDPAKCSGTGGSQQYCTKDKYPEEWDEYAGADIPEDYWSSTQSNNTNAWAVTFCDGHIFAYPKDNYYRVRCFLGR